MQGPSQIPRTGGWLGADGQLCRSKGAVVLDNVEDQCTREEVARSQHLPCTCQERVSSSSSRDLREQPKKRDGDFASQGQGLAGAPPVQLEMKLEWRIGENRTEQGCVMQVVLLGGRQTARLRMVEGRRGA